MQSFRHSLCPLQFFGGVIEEESFLAEIELLETTTRDKLVISLIHHHKALSGIFYGLLKTVSTFKQQRNGGFRVEWAAGAERVGGNVLLLQLE